jgi:hypothetical protein
VLRDKPHLQFVAADDVADQQVIRAWTGASSRPFGGRGMSVVSAT